MTEDKVAGNGVRLQKIIQAAGIASRRKAEELIASGQVSVNGKIVTELGTKADAERDAIKVSGKLIGKREQYVYMLLNKPKEYVTTVSDPEGRATVMHLLPDAGARLYPVGRLDYHSEGLLLFTNDGDLANKLTRASSNVAKVYHVKVSGQPAEHDIERLRGGIVINEGQRNSRRVRTAPAQIRLIKTADNPWFEVVLREGRNRQIRKMFEEIGHHVEKIRRVAYGPINLDVDIGKARPLKDREVAILKAAADGREYRSSAAAPLGDKRRRPRPRQKSIKKQF